MSTTLQYPVRIVMVGEYAEGAIVVEHTDFPPFPEGVKAIVEGVWEEQVALNPSLRRGPLLAARSVTERDGKLHLVCGLSDYGNFMGSTSSPEIPEEHRHRAVGFLAVTVTSDDCIMLGVRSSHIDWGTLRHVVPAGRLSPDRKDPYTAIRYEYGDELGLQPEEIENLKCLGVVSDLTLKRENFEFVFMGSTRLTSRQVMERALTAKSAGEHCQIEVVPWQKGIMQDLLFVEPAAYVPTGWAAVALCLRSDLGQADAFPGWEPTVRSYEEHMGRRLTMLQKRK